MGETPKRKASIPDTLGQETHEQQIFCYFSRGLYASDDIMGTGDHPLGFISCARPPRNAGSTASAHPFGDFPGARLCGFHL